MGSIATVDMETYVGLTCMCKCVRVIISNGTRCVAKAGAGHNTESQAADGTITKAFTVADKTFEPQVFVFHVAVSIETSTAYMSQCKKAG